MDITKDRMEAFYTLYGQIEDVSAGINKVDIAIGVFVLHVTMTHKRFSEIPNILMCREKRMPVVVEGRQPHCWLCGASGHTFDMCPSKNMAPQPRQKQQQQQNR